VESADDQIGLLREELLKVKREKNKLGSRIKILEDEVEIGRGITDNVKHENSEFVNRVKNLELDLRNIQCVQKGRLISFCLFLRVRKSYGS
jgi:hypothetical protein